jgi:hypothetical protein
MSNWAEQHARKEILHQIVQHLGNLNSLIGIILKDGVEIIPAQDLKVEQLTFLLAVLQQQASQSATESVKQVRQSGAYLILSQVLFEQLKNSQALPKEKIESTVTVKPKRKAKAQRTPSNRKSTSKAVIYTNKPPSKSRVTRAPFESRLAKLQRLGIQPSLKLLEILDRVKRGK